MELQPKTQQESPPSGLVERRQEPRFEASNLVHVTSLDKQGNAMDFATGLTINLSTGGMRLEMLSHPLPKGSKVKLSLQLNQQEVDLLGTLIYVEEVDRNRYAMGIEFVELSPDTKALLTDYIGSQSQDCPA